MSDDLREQLAEALTAHLPGYVDGTCGCGDGTDTDVRHLTDALLPLIREHVAAAVQAERERIAELLAAVPDEYYPVDVFGGPLSTDESRQANELLKAEGLPTYDRVGANAMRHAYRRAAVIAREEPHERSRTMSEPIDLDAIEARTNAATDELWRAATSGPANGDHWYVVADGEAIAWITSNDGENEAQREPDAEFIAHARQDIPALVAEIRSLRTVIGIADKAGADILDERNALYVLLTHPAAAELLDHHRYLTSGVHGSCSCRMDHGPGTETPEQWIAHLLEAGRLEHGIGGGSWPS